MDDPLAQTLLMEPDIIEVVSMGDRKVEVVSKARKQADHLV